MIKLKFIILSFALIMSVVTMAGDFSFRHINMRDGLSNEQVNDVYKDDAGFMWFSTAWGLNRYDGYNMKVFVNNPNDEHSIASNYVEWVQGLKDGKLLVKTPIALQIYDSYTEKFTVADELHDAFGVEGRFDVVFVDDYKRIWVAVAQKIYTYTPESQALSTIDLSEKLQQKNGRIIAISQDKTGMLFICYDGTLLHYEGGKTIITQTPIGTGRHWIYVDSENNYWFWSTSGLGVWHYNTNRREWFHCDSSKDALYQIPDYHVRCISEDAQKRIWVATDHGGLSIIDQKLRNCRTLRNDKYESRSIQSNSITVSYCDRDGIMWLGYYNNGISLYDESLFKFQHEKLPAHDGDTDGQNDINTFEEDRYGNIWMGTNGNGLVRIDRKTGKCQWFRHSDSDPNSIPSDIIVKLFASSDGSLWVGTYLGGLSRYDGTKFINYLERKDVPAAMACQDVWDINEDEEGNLWVGSLGSGLSSYNLKTHKSEEYKAENNMINLNYVSSFCLTHDGQVVVGTAFGVSVINPKLHTSTPLGGDKNEALWHENINMVYEDTRGLIWLGTRSGVNVVDIKANRNWTLNISSGMVSEVISGIVEDNNKNMWITTSGGVSNIIVSRNPRNEDYAFNIFNYTEQDGLQSTSFNVKSIKKTSYGEILMGGTLGYNRFMPENIKYNRVVPQTQFVGLKVFDNPVEVGQKYGEKIILDRAIQYSDEVKIDYTQNMFTIDFSAFSFILPEKNQFSYCLKGFSDKWITTNQPSVTYTNLAPGRYTFSVKASNCDGYWSDEVSSISIVILPPWWKTPVAYFFYFAILIGIILALRWQIREEERVRQRLNQVSDEVQKNKEVDELKLKFFTNISHELRTPLSLVITPVESLLDEVKGQDIEPKLRLIHRNAQKLLDIVNQLLDFRNSFSGQSKPTLYDGDLVNFVRATAETFSGFAERKINFTIKPIVPVILTKFDRDKTSRIVSNLLSNAFKYTNEGGSVELSIDRKDNWAIIKVADTGIGIADEYKDKVFERFYQVPREEGQEKGGSGIGLNLVAELVEVLEGKIEIKDNEGGGTVFIVSLPILAGDDRNPEADDQKQVNNQDASKETGDDSDGADAEAVDEKKTILIVDDNQDFRQLLIDTFETEYYIIQARDGQEAFELAVENIPDLILSDVMMPLVDGLELCRRIKKDIRTSHIPFILLTAKDTDESKIEGLQVGADDYISKPFNAQILKLKVSNLVEKRLEGQKKFASQIDPEPSRIDITPLDEKLIQKAIKYVEDNITKDISVEDMAKEMGMSRVHLYKKLSALTGRSPVEFIRLIRLKRAAQMLRDKQQNIGNIAYAVGFSSPRIFTQKFKDEFGILPSEYQDQQEDTQKFKDEFGGF